MVHLTEPNQSCKLVADFQASPDFRSHMLPLSDGEDNISSTPKSDSQ